MKKPAIIRLLGVLIAAAALLGGCKGEGIFASIAVSEKIIDGSLPDGVSPSNVFMLTADLSDDATVNPVDYGYFSSGPRLFRKAGIDTGANWNPVGLPAGYEAIQSIAASDNVLVMALSKGYGSDYRTTLYYMGVDTAADPDVMVTGTITGGDFPGSDSAWQEISVFCPDPSVDTFYVGVQQKSGTHGETDNLVETDFHGAFTVDPVTGGTLSAVAQTLTGDYVAAAAAGGGAIRFAVVDDSATTGYLINESGTPIVTVPADLGPMTDIAYLNVVGAFIAGSRTDSGLFVGTNGTNWYTVSGVGVDDTHVSFADVTGALTDTVLVGRDTLGGSGGYIEVNTGGGVPAADGAWSVQSNSFADMVQYTSSSLPDVSITEFSKIGSYLYASTRSEGLWRLDDSAAGNAWTDE